MKKGLCMILTILFVLGAFAACGGKQQTNGETDATEQTADKKISIVATIFPEYDWVRELLGDKADEFDLSLLLDNGVDLHSFQPTAADIMKIHDCDLFIYAGGESDEWVDEVLAAANNTDLIAVNLLETVGDLAKTEEIKEGMQSEEEEEEEEPEYDEHVWLSLKNAAMICEYVAEQLVKLSPENKDAIEANTAAYTEKLRALDAEYRAAADAAPVKTLLFGDRFPFRYLVDDYGLDYYAAFSGCSAESEASFETIIFLAKKTDELGLHAIMQIETADGSIANTIRSNTATKDQKILTLNSLQSMTSDDVKNGRSYYTEMQNNLAVLKEALQ